MSPASKVWFIPVDDGSDIPFSAERLRMLLQRSVFPKLVSKGTRAHIKLHFGEKGNTGFVRPAIVNEISGTVKEKGGTTIISDTNTLYRGRRIKSADHLALAREHGFTDTATGGTVMIADEQDPSSVLSVDVNGRYVTTAKILRCYTEADLLIGVAHFKGHLVTGFGGAIKNIGMGCATRQGKLAQHSGMAPFIIQKKCIGCGACRDVCPVGAITVSDGKASLDAETCIGCASCIAACRSSAVEINWRGGAAVMVERMVEYACATLGNCKKKVFINAVYHITAECDCLAKDDPRIAPDVGFFISSDPVAVDQASYDMVCSRAGGFDPFRKAHPQRDSLRQLDYAERMGLGVRRYELVKV
jgi:uncharacterized Fe-S center protein